MPPFSSDYPAPEKDGRTGAVSAGCVFWMHGTKRAFSTTPQDHANCSVGSYTHGLIDFEEAASRDDVGTILEVGWVTPEAAQALPSISPRPAAIIYAPLSQADEADVVLLRISGLGMMTLKDALPDLKIEGKPQCHIIALAKQENIPAASTGCALSRARTGMKAEEMTCALPAARLEEMVEKIEAAAELNRGVARYAGKDGERFAPANQNAS